MNYESKEQKSASFKAWINERDSDGFTAGHLAAHRGNVKIVLLYKEEGGDLMVRSNKGLSMFHVAA